MKKNLIWLLAAVLCVASCAKTASSGKNDATKRYFDAWMQVYHPDAFATGRCEPGYYILEDHPSNGEIIGEADDSLFVRVEYTAKDLDGNVSTTSSASLSQQVGTYDESYYYGPEIWYVPDLYKGLQASLATMAVGGSRTIAHPGWLATTDSYDTEKGYLDNVSGTDAIYSIKIIEKIHRNIYEWEIDSISRHLVKYYPSIYGTDPKVAKADSSGMHGFYYMQLKAPKWVSENTDTTVFINYIGRLLNGKVFDTTIKDTAILHGIYSESKSYVPVQINMADSYSDITMGDSTDSDESSLITGFAFMLSKMNAYEKGRAIFYSALGYYYNGSGYSIPAYCPLEFEVELTDEVEE